MNGMKKKLAVLLVVIMAATLLSGCMSKSADDLYSLPQLPDKYIKLQARIDEVLSSGAEFSAPLSGTYRQTVLIKDIDGDGKDEAIAFFARRADDKPLKVYIFRSTGDDYETAAVIEGEGTAIESIGFTDMNANGVLEIAVGWQLTAEVNMLSVYSMAGFQPVRIISTDYHEYTITQLSGRDDIVVFRMPEADLSGEAILYVMASDGEIVSTTARMTGGVESLVRIRSGSLLGGDKAVYVEQVLTGNKINTDVFAYKGRSITNISKNDLEDAENDTVRTYAVYCRDINGDGVLDVPKPVALPGQPETTSYYVIEWYSYYRSGLKELAATTYNNYSDGWYLSIHERWGTDFTVRREDSVSGERAIVFSAMDGDEVGGDFLTIYAISGENRKDRAVVGERFVLKEEESVVYAAEILTGVTGADVYVTKQLIRDNFGIIYSEWITGDV